MRGDADLRHRREHVLRLLFFAIAVPVTDVPASALAAPVPDQPLAVLTLAHDTQRPFGGPYSRVRNLAAALIRERSRRCEAAFPVPHFPTSSFVHG